MANTIQVKLVVFCIYLGSLQTCCTGQQDFPTVHINAKHYTRNFLFYFVFVWGAHKLATLDSETGPLPQPPTMHELCPSSLALMAHNGVQTDMLHLRIAVIHTLPHLEPGYLWLRVGLCLAGESDRPVDLDHNVVVGCVTFQPRRRCHIHVVQRLVHPSRVTDDAGEGATMDLTHLSNPHH